MKIGTNPSGSAATAESSVNTNDLSTNQNSKVRTPSLNIRVGDEVTKTQTAHVSQVTTESGQSASRAEALGKRTLAVA